MEKQIAQVPLDGRACIRMVDEQLKVLKRDISMLDYIKNFFTSVKNEVVKLVTNKNPSDLKRPQSIKNFTLFKKDLEDVIKPEIPDSSASVTKVDRSKG